MSGEPTGEGAPFQPEVEEHAEQGTPMGESESVFAAHRKLPHTDDSGKATLDAVASATAQLDQETAEGTGEDSVEPGLTKIPADLHAHRELPANDKKFDAKYYEDAVKGLDYKPKALSNPWPEDERRGGEPVSFKEGLMELLERRDEVLIAGVGKVLENELAVDEHGKPLPKDQQDAAWKAIAEAARRHDKVNPAATDETTQSKLNEEPNPPTDLKPIIKQGA